MHNSLDLHTKRKSVKKHSRKAIKGYIDFYKYVVSYLTNIDLDNIDYDELKFVFEICSELMISDVLDDITSLNTQEIDAYTYLHNLIIGILNKEVSNKFLGDIMIQRSFQDGEYLTIPELDYDICKLYSKLGLERVSKFDDALNDPDCGGYAKVDSLDIQINVFSSYYVDKMHFTKEEIRSLNIGILKVIRHEMAHIKQYLYHSDVYGLKYDSSSELVQVLKQEKLYETLHDYLPSEYSADMEAYNELIEDLARDYNNIFSYELIWEVEDLMNERSEEYPNNPLEKMANIVSKMAKYGQVSVDRYNIIISKLNEINEHFKKDNGISRKLVK